MNLRKTPKSSREEFLIFLPGGAHPSTKPNHCGQESHTDTRLEQTSRGLWDGAGLGGCRALPFACGTASPPIPEGGPCPTRTVASAPMTSLHQQRTSWPQGALLAVYAFSEPRERLGQKLTPAQVEGRKQRPKKIN